MWGHCPRRMQTEFRSGMGVGAIVIAVVHFIAG